jgi:hypothetical protein
MPCAVPFCGWSRTVFVLVDGSPLAVPKEVLPPTTIALQALRGHPDDGKEIAWRRLG